jgi:hypothetical protein
MPVEAFRHANIFVSYKAFIDAPEVLVLADKDTIGILNAGSAVQRLFPTGGKAMTLTIKNRATGAVLLDSVFTPLPENKFELFITDLLGITQFYQPPANMPDAHTARVQLFHRITYQGAEKKLNFKFYLANATADSFAETPYVLNNVVYGQPSAFIDLPLSEGKNYYIKTYDAETGELLLDLFEGFGGYGSMSVTGGKQQVAIVKAADDPNYGIFYDNPWDTLFY